MTGDAGHLYDRIAQEVPTIAVSAAQRRSAPATRFVRVVHHGVDPTAFPLGDGEGSYLLVLGRMDPVKGIHVAVDVARRAGVPLLVAGPARSDAERRYFATQVEPRLGPGVTYVGEVGGERKLSLLRNARALLMPVQWEEPFGMVVVEALATGTPVLAFDRGAMAEIVEDGRTGLICADADAMVEAVARVDALDRGVCRAAVEDRFSS